MWRVLITVVFATLVAVVAAQLELVAAVAGSEHLDGGGRYQVVSVTDGDTVRLGGVAESVRLIGIDAPESSAHRYGFAECAGAEATEFVSGLLTGVEVDVVAGVDPTDRWGRHLAYLFSVDGSLINADIVAAGHARAVSYPPNTTHDATIAAAEDHAKGFRLGLWNHCDPSPDPY